jgi:hypothetical protein
MLFVLKSATFKHSRSVSKKYNELYGMIIGNHLEGKRTHAMHTHVKHGNFEIMVIRYAKLQSRKK